MEFYDILKSTDYSVWIINVVLSHFIDYYLR
jgi:hypothetical protein